MVSLSAGILMSKNLYPLGRRIRLWMDTIRTHVPICKIYRRHIIIINNKADLS
jgi:hypothetical protein